MSKYTHLRRPGAAIVADDPYDRLVGALVGAHEDVADPTALLFGVPFDTTTMARRGSREGPAAIRRALNGLLTYHGGYGVELSAETRIADCGDVAVLHTDVEETWRRIAETVVELAAEGPTLVALGGDHGMTYPVLRGLTRERARALGVIVFDAHYDVRPSHAGQPASGVPFRYALERLDGRVAGGNCTQIGIAGWENAAAAASYAHAAEIHSVSAREVHNGSLGAIVERALERALDGTDGVWLSLDIDVLDGAFAPGTNAPTSGGLTSHQLLEAVWQIGREPAVLGLDVVEVSPPLDRDRQTAQIAATAVLTFLAARVAASSERALDAASVARAE